VFDPDTRHIVRRKLLAGDYSLEGYESASRRERKSLDDTSRPLSPSGTASLVSCGFCPVDVACSSSRRRSRRPGAPLSIRAHPNAVLGATLSIIIDKTCRCSSA